MAKTYNTNVGKPQTRSSTKGVYKATSKVKEERKQAGRDSSSALKAKVERTKRQLSAEQTARRKAGEGSAARTKSQIKADTSREKAGKPTSINRSPSIRMRGAGGGMGGLSLKGPSRKWPFNN